MQLFPLDLPLLPAGSLAGVAVAGRVAMPGPCSELCPRCVTATIVTWGSVAAVAVQSIPILGRVLQREPDSRLCALSNLCNRI